MNIEPNEEKVSTQSVIDALGMALKGLEQKDFISDQEISSVYKIREKLIKMKLKQRTLFDVIKHDVWNNS